MDLLGGTGGLLVYCIYLIYHARPLTHLKLPLSDLGPKPNDRLADNLAISRISHLASAQLPHAHASRRRGLASILLRRAGRSQNDAMVCPSANAFRTTSGPEGYRGTY